MKPSYAEDPRRLEGTILDQRYSIERWVGSGGMGTVYEARSLSQGQRVAVKLLQPQYHREPTYCRRFVREARVTSRIIHPNVIRVLDYGETIDGRAFSVMEYLVGRDLSKRIRSDGALDWPQARMILLQVVAGLQAIHDAGVIHRDIKPSNIFLIGGDDGRAPSVKVLDLGLAKAVDPSSSLAETLTLVDEVMGTAQYMAPERVQGEEADVRSDIYSLGIMAFRMLTGMLPLWGGKASTVRKLMRRMREPPPSVMALVPSLPVEADALIRRCMARAPSRRFQSLRGLKLALLAAPEQGEGCDGRGCELPMVVDELESTLSVSGVGELETVPVGAAPWVGVC